MKFFSLYVVALQINQTGHRWQYIYLKHTYIYILMLKIDDKNFLHIFLYVLSSCSIDFMISGGNWLM